MVNPVASVTACDCDAARFEMTTLPTIRQACDKKHALATYLSCFNVQEKGFPLYDASKPPVGKAKNGVTMCRDNKDLLETLFQYVPRWHTVATCYTEWRLHMLAVGAPHPDKRPCRPSAVAYFT